MNPGYNFPNSSKYDPEKHPALALELLSQGKSIISFAAAANITKVTLHNWREAHPELEDAIQLGLIKGQEFWENWADDSMVAGNPINNTVLGMTLASRYGAATKRTLKVKGMANANTAADRSKLLQRELEQGNLVPEEATALTNITTAINEMTTLAALEQDIKDIKSKVDKA